MDDPHYIGVAGDWHGNAQWGKSAIKQISDRLEKEKRKIILQLGDFGVWHPPGDERWTFAGTEHIRQSYLSALTEALHDSGAELWFIDGNHENHRLLAGLHGKLPNRDESWITHRIRHLSRGTRWSWHSREWLAVGGATSVDKLSRTEGISWFAEEEITPEQETAIITAGPADVILSHDAPTDAPVTLMTPPPDNWLPMIPGAEAHRERLQRICEKVKPSYLFHGHYHQYRETRNLPAAWGHCDFFALDMDWTQGNWGILDTKTMNWYLTEDIP